MKKLERHRMLKGRNKRKLGQSKRGQGQGHYRKERVLGECRKKERRKRQELGELRTRSLC
jgi:hypothetical protein